MNKTLTINLGGLVFHIDEDAYLHLEKYLATLKRQFSRTSGGGEIIADIEARLAELFRERTGPEKEVISQADVDHVIGIMGQPEDYLTDEEPIAQTAEPQTDYIYQRKRLFRDIDNRIIGGVSAGLAAYFNIDVIWVRILFLVLLFSGFGFLLYIIMWIITPKAVTTAEKLQMRGEPVTVSTIEKSIRDEMGAVGDTARRYAEEFKKKDFRGRSRGFFGNLDDFLGEAFRLFFKVLGKIIGFFFLLLGFVILFSLFMGIVVGGATIFGTEYSIPQLLEILSMVTIDETHHNWFLAGIAMSAAGPLILLVYFGIRLLFSVDPLNRGTRNGLILITIIGIIVLVNTSVRLGLQFDERSSITEEIQLPNTQNFYLTAQQDSVFNTFFYDEDEQWQLSENGVLVNFVEIDVQLSSDSTAYLEVKRKSRGPSKVKSREFVEAIDYQVNINDSLLEIPAYFRLKKDDKFRDQEVEVTLFLPEGSSVFLDKTLREYLDNIKNVQNMWDFRMVGQKWLVTPRGLSCEGCPMPEIQEDSEDEIDEEWEDSSDSENLEIKINERGVDVRHREEKA